MSEHNLMIGPGIASFRSDGDLSVVFNTSRPKVVDFELKLYDIFIPILGILIIIINLTIVISSGLILYRGQQPRSTYLFLGNVALSDLVIGIAVLFGQYYPEKYRTELVCAIEIGLTVSASVTSVYSIGLIAVDRFLYILNGLQYQRYIYPNRARVMILSTWLIGGIVGFLPAMGYRADTDNGKLCWFIIIEPPELVLATTSIGLIPLIVIIVLYSIILYHALRKISQLKSAAKDRRGINSGNLRLFRGGQNPSSASLSVIPDRVPITGHDDHSEEDVPQRRCCGIFKRQEAKIRITPVYNPSKWKAIKIVLLTTGSFFITWFPYFVASAMFAMCDPKKNPRFCDGLKVAIASPLAILGLSNSVLNPLVYAWWHTGFRESLKKMFRGICRKNRLSCNGDSSIESNRSPTHTRTTFLHRNHPDHEVSEDLEHNPIIKSRNENDRHHGAQNLNYDVRADVEGVRRTDLRNSKGTRN